MGIPRFVFHIVFLFCLSINASAKEPVIAKEDRKSKCGDIVIPYPFGMQTGCYYNDWFKVDCNETDNIPILSRTTVSSNTTFEGLAGIPFVILQSLNSFGAVSCGTLVLMHQDNATVGGCLSICDEKYYNNGVVGTCNGINCCPTALPENLDTLNVTVQKSSGSYGNYVDEGSCKYAFVAGLDTFNYYEKSNWDDLASLSGVPMVLDWWLIDNGSYSSSPYSNGYRYRNSYYKYNSSSFYNSNGTKIQCPCKRPTNGSYPYIDEGCKDVECIDQVSGYTCRTVPEEKSNLKMILIGVFSGVIGLFILLIGAWWLYNVIEKRKEIALKQKFFRRNGGLLLQQQLSSGEVNVDKIKMYDSEELEKAIDGFNINRILGKVVSEPFTKQC